MHISAFDFDLPNDLIATRPCRPRDHAKLLQITPVKFSDHIVKDLPDLLRPGDLLVCNDTKVIPAQLECRRGEGRVQLTLHLHAGPGCWRAFAKPARRLRVGDRIDIGPDFAATITAKDGGEVTLDFALDDAGLRQKLEKFGIMPLPPYIRKMRDVDEADLSDYQTAFAAREGAVAAPTAGLHFTPELLAALDARKIERTLVTLHVGAGTFLPVKVEDTVDHKMHAEWGEIRPDVADKINRTRAAGGRIVAVGTTSLRLLESAARADGVVQPFAAETDIFITPGYKFRAVDILMTNFHLPKSTLFMLVSAFAGLTRMQQAYDYAKAEKYRFYSYGDSSLIFPEGVKP
jgi:S-adenosylmethionine:tRNA ribosyltransferase-isomerase